ncbi:hypothetical protein D3C77_675330 [compost metagenome]
MKRHMVAMSGIDTGRMMRIKMLTSLAPSIRADSPISSGISLKNEMAMSRKNKLSIPGMT